MSIEEAIWKQLEPKMEAMITRRLLAFHDAMSERKEISQAANVPDPAEGPVKPIDHYNQERTA